MSIRIVLARPEDASLISATRRLVWDETYRGIYPDEMLDHYDEAFHTARDRTRIESPGNVHYLFMDGTACVGYCSFGPYHYGIYKDFTLCLNSLYILSSHKGRGLGREAFALLRRFAKQQGIGKFFCGCNIHNLPAQNFYRHMGAIEGLRCGGHENRSEDIVYFEFTVGE